MFYFLFFHPIQNAVRCHELSNRRISHGKTRTRALVVHQRARNPPLTGNYYKNGFARRGGPQAQVPGHCRALQVNPIKYESE